MTSMRRALELAHRALGTTSPNPAVGAVVIQEGRIVGEGFTQPPGQAHAEVLAVAQAGERARGGALYVTLEPCCHVGRTPSCTRAIVQAGVTEVHMALLDPNPLVSGKGREALEQAGVRTSVGEEEGPARRLNEAYLKFIVTRRPFVTAKFAASLDGKIATRTGASRWIIGEAARREAHHLRAQADAFMVGVNTVLADDPQLTARDAADLPLPRQPLRVVVDSRGRTPDGARLFREYGPVLLAGSRLTPGRKEALGRRGVEVVLLPAEDDLVDLQALLAHLGQRDMANLLVEGGGTLLGALFDQGLVDKVVAFLAPLIVGGSDAVPAVAGRGAGLMAEALRLRDVEVERVGEDIMVVGYPMMEGVDQGPVLQARGDPSA